MRAFNPSPEFSAKLGANREGKFTPVQRREIIIAALGTGCGLVVVLFLMANILFLTFSGFSPGGIAGWVFTIFFVLSFTFMALTLYFNARNYIPDMMSESPVSQSQGVLKIQMPQRDRIELPFSYIVGDYSFAPFMVPHEVPMEKGREYIVYYAARSRMFLSIEPVDYAA